MLSWVSPFNLNISQKNAIFFFLEKKTFFLPLHTGSCFPIHGRAPAPPQGYRCRAGAYPTPVYHSWQAHSEGRETPGIEPLTSQAADELSTNWANRSAKCSIERPQHFGIQFGYIWQPFPRWVSPFNTEHGKDSHFSRHFGTLLWFCYF